MIKETLLRTPTQPFETTPVRRTPAAMLHHPRLAQTLILRQLPQISPPVPCLKEASVVFVPFASRACGPPPLSPYCGAAFPPPSGGLTAAISTEHY